MSISHHTKWDTVIGGDGKATNPLAGATYNEDHDITPFPIADILTGVYKNATVVVFAFTTTRVITHGLGAIPDEYSITPLVLCGVQWFISDETATQCTLNILAPQETDLTFKFSAKVL